MQENSFEKKVQQKMESLSFEPSEPVWQKVEMQIQQKRRRRLVFLLLPLLLAGGGLALYFASKEPSSLTPVAQTGQQTNTSIDNQSAPKDSGNTFYPINTETQNADPKYTPTPQKEKQTFVKQQEKKHNTGQKEKQTFLASSKKKLQQAAPVAASQENRKAEELDLLSNNLHALVLQNEIDIKEGRKAENGNLSNPFQRKAAPKDDDKSIAAGKEKELVDLPLLPDSLMQETAAKEINTQQDSSEMKLEQMPKGKEKVWHWAINTKVGFSGLRSNMINVFGTEASSDFSASPSTGNNGTPQFSVAPKVSNNIAYSIGASVRRQAAKNAFISVGLQYSYYSTQYNIGTQVNRDTALSFNGRLESVRSYYTSSGSASTYTNHYHYLELPLAIDYTPFKKLPLQLQHGVSIGRLLSSNALYHNSAAGLYFKTDEWMRKTSFNLFTSVDYRLFQKRSFSLFAGPQLQWALTPVQQPSEAKKQHLFFAGLQTQLRF